MAFDGLHIIWNNTWPPYDARGDWFGLHKLYQQLAQNGHYYKLSAPLSANIPKALPTNAITLTLNEKNEVKRYLCALTAPGGDRITGDLPMACCSVTSKAVHLLFVPALTSHSQIIGRLKSKTASQVLWSPERKSQKHIWSSRYWFANINRIEAIAKIEHFINAQHNN
jgi:hypothetical protein